METVNKENATNQAFNDFIEVQKELPKIKKSKQVKLAGRSYSYASLEDIIEVVRPILNKHHFALSQQVCSDDKGHLGVRTVLMHTSGTVLKSDLVTIPLPNQGNICQAAGSARTYLCRYSLSSFLCVADTEDDDASSYERVNTFRPQVRQMNNNFRPMNNNFRPAPQAVIIGNRG